MKVVCSGNTNAGRALGAPPRTPSPVCGPDGLGPGHAVRQQVTLLPTCVRGLLGVVSLGSKPAPAKDGALPLPSSRCILPLERPVEKCF